MSQDRDLVEEERQAAARLAARGEDRARPSQTGGGMDPGTRKLAIVAGGLGGLLVLMVGGWSLLGHRPSGVPILSPPPGPVRVKPLDPGGMQLMGAQVAQTNETGAEALAPGPEQAAPQALQAEVDKARQADRPAAVPAPVRTGSAASTTAAPAAVASDAVVPGSVLPGAAATGPMATGPASTGLGSSDARPSDAGSSAAPAAAPLATAAPAPATPAVRQHAENETAGASSDEAAPAGGHHSVQLAALDSEAAARTEWSRISHRAPSLFGGRTPVIVATSRGGKQFFRLRTGGFDSIAEATGFCARARAAGIACTLADF